MLANCPLAVWHQETGWLLPRYDGVGRKLTAAPMRLAATVKELFILRNRGNGVHVKLVVERILEHDNPPTREQGTDRPGRSIGAENQKRS
jgi:hypothetical protein